MLKKLVAVAFAAALVFAGAACSDDDESGGGGSTQSQLADVLKDDASADGTELSDEEADCIAGALIDLIGEDAVQEALDSGTEPDVDALMGDDPEAALDFVDAMMECAPDLMGDAISEGMEEGDSEG